MRATNCTKCLLGKLLLSNNSCDEKKCDEGFFINETECQNCSLNCKQCNNFSFCSDCFQPYILRNASCFACNEGFYYEQVIGQCNPCQANCLTCTNKVSCLTCTSNSFFIIDEKNTIQCKDSCPDGYYSEYFNCFGKKN